MSSDNVMGSQAIESPAVHPGGLVTVAFLKAKLDEGSDHLGIFMPLVLDVIANNLGQTFFTVDVQSALASTHKLTMPQQTVYTLLKRAIKKGYLKREFGRYERVKLPVTPRIDTQTTILKLGQRRLADAFVEHASKRSLALNPESALDLLLNFLEDEQVGLLLENAPDGYQNHRLTRQERAVVAEFVEHILRHDAALRGVLSDILEGLVLYHAAFLPELSLGTKRFKDLRVYFDSDLVRQTLGYEGPAIQTLMRETIMFLTREGARCLVFDKTVNEIRRILRYFESTVSTPSRGMTVRQSVMARHFLTQQYPPSDIREMGALLEESITQEGLQIIAMPSRVPKYVALESALQKRLADPKTMDLSAPRIGHDVDCVAAILTLRRGYIPQTLEDSRAVFASASGLVIRNTTRWYREDEHGSGIAPIVHIRVLSNLAWLKSPKLCAEFKLHELVALCAAALHPSQETWHRFLRHLETLEKSGKMTSDETVLILVSSMSDDLLADAENSGSGDVDASSMDEVVRRVKESYTSEYDSKLSEATGRVEAERARAEAAESRAAEREHYSQMRVLKRAQRWARNSTALAYYVVLGIVLAGAIELFLGHPFRAGLFNAGAAAVLVIFIALEAFGIMRHMITLRERTESHLSASFEKWLSAG